MWPESSLERHRLQRDSQTVLAGASDVELGGLAGDDDLRRLPARNPTESRVTAARIGTILMHAIGFRVILVTIREMRPLPKKELT